jgi:hypothetical protein
MTYSLRQEHRVSSQRISVQFVSFVAKSLHDPMQTRKATRSNKNPKLIRPKGVPFEAIAESLATNGSIITSHLGTICLLRRQITSWPYANQNIYSIKQESQTHTTEGSLIRGDSRVPYDQRESHHSASRYNLSPTSPNHSMTLFKPEKQLDQTRILNSYDRRESHSRR